MSAYDEIREAIRIHDKDKLEGSDIDRMAAAVVARLRLSTEPGHEHSWQRRQPGFQKCCLECGQQIYVVEMPIRLT